MNPKVIGLVGYARSGKDTVANYLNELANYRRIRSATPIKRMVVTLLRELGWQNLHSDKRWWPTPTSPSWDMNDEELELFIEANKDSIASDLLPGITIRILMQTLGSEWGRNVIHTDMWMRISLNKSKTCLAIDRPCVWTDVRFPNELEAVKHLGGQIWYVYRPNVSIMDHVSEAHISSLSKSSSKTVRNTGSLDDLLEQVKKCLQDS